MTRCFCNHTIHGHRTFVTIPGMAIFPCLVMFFVLEIPTRGSCLVGWILTPKIHCQPDHTKFGHVFAPCVEIPNDAFRAVENSHSIFGSTRSRVRGGIFSLWGINISAKNKRRNNSHIMKKCTLHTLPTHMCTHMCTHTEISTHMHTWKHAHTHMYMYANTHMHTDRDALWHTRAHTHTHTHTWCTQTGKDAHTLSGHSQILAQCNPTNHSFLNRQKRYIPVQTKL